MTPRSSKVERSPYKAKAESITILKRDGKEVFRGTYFECVGYIHDNAPYSFHHALKYEGYSIEEEK